MRFVRNWKISLPVAGVVLAGLAWLAFGFFGFHTAFIDDEVSEAAPEFDVATPPAEPVSANADEAAGGDDGTAPAESDAENDTDTDSDSDSDSDTVTGADTDAEGATDPADDAAVESTRPVETAAEAPAAEAANEIVVEASGSFSGNSRYDVTGEAAVLGNGTGQRFLRLENFESDNGPDLNVYLFNPNDSSDFIDLGDLKGNIGDQNYEIPADVDLSVYSEVSIWCVRFGVGFGSADLMSA